MRILQLNPMHPPKYSSIYSSVRLSISVCPSDCPSIICPSVHQPIHEYPNFPCIHHSNQAGRREKQQHLPVQTMPSMPSGGNIGLAVDHHHGTLLLWQHNDIGSPLPTSQIGVLSGLVSRFANVCGYAATWSQSRHRSTTMCSSMCPPVGISRTSSSRMQLSARS